MVNESLTGLTTVDSKVVTHCWTEQNSMDPLMSFWSASLPQWSQMDCFLITIQLWNSNVWSQPKKSLLWVRVAKRVFIKYIYISSWHILSSPERKMSYRMRWRSEWYQQKKGYNNDCINMELGSAMLFKRSSRKDAIQWPFPRNHATTLLKQKPHKQILNWFHALKGMHACRWADASQHDLQMHVKGRFWC